MNKALTIREPKLEELDQVLALWEKQYNFHHNLDSVYYIKYCEANARKYKKYLKQCILEKNPRILVAEIEAKLVGFITFDNGSEDYLDSNIKEFGTIFELFVDKRYKNQGIGGKLMAAVEKIFKAEGFKFVEAQCSAYNKGALKFYEKNKYTSRQFFLLKKLG